MATWQASFAIIPTGPFPVDYAHHLDEIASRYPSWNTDITAWGGEDSDRIEIYSEKGKPVDGLLRIDCRQDNAQFVRGVLTVLRQWGFMLETEQGLGIEPELDLFTRALEGSRAFRFATNPELYLRRLRIGGLDDA